MSDSMSALTRARDLQQRLGFSASEARMRTDSAGHFPMRIPAAWVELVRDGGAADPLLRQVLPDPAEMHPDPEESADAVGDRDAERTPGLIIKYAHRALVIATGACALHCRFCFRREFPYSDSQAGGSRWQAIIDEIAKDSTLTEVILSGGDPLSISNSRLASMLDDLEQLPNLRRIRIHTRHPVADPDRIDAEFCARIQACSLDVIVVLHCNHPRELTPRAAAALSRLQGAKATLLNQSVLLRGVNDSVQILAELSERLFDCGVLPYYLHQLDRVTGTSHFHVPLEQSVALVRGLRSQLPGYLVPRFVREDRGQPAKTILG